MSWLAIVVVIMGIYLAFKVLGLAIRIGLILLVVVALYWLFAPYLGMDNSSLASAAAMVGS